MKGTAGGVAFALDEVLPASPAYRWTLNHTMRLDDPMALFRTGLTTVGVGMTVRPTERLFDLAKTIRSKNAGVDP